MTPTASARAIADALDQRRATNTFRQRRALRVIDSTHVEIDGRLLINFASNNYLGLTHHPRVVAAFTQAAERSGVGSGAAGLITGHTEDHASAERRLALWKGAESAVLLSSGYVANLAVVQTLAAIFGVGGVRFLLDKLAHASLIDAVLASGCEFRTFPHNDVTRLRQLLTDKPAIQHVVITESIFSMDGDAADLARIAELKQEFPFLLVLDEAHGSGVYGANGSGYAAEAGFPAFADLTIVTLSKALGCVGGAVCASSLLCDAVINFGRPYIFSTALPPAVPAAVEAAIAVMQQEPQRQQRVRELAAHVRSTLRLAGDSPIIPIVLGNETAALSAAEELKNRGILVVAVRPPTVPQGTSRLRITLCCDHSDAEVESLLAGLLKISGG